jgi:hypothetical protein
MHLIEIFKSSQMAYKSRGNYIQSEVQLESLLLQHRPLHFPGEAVASER